VIINSNISNDSYLETDEDFDDTFICCSTIRGQKEKEKEKQQQKEKAFNPRIENNLEVEDQ
jgi:hypothetical protein